MIRGGGRGTKREGERHECIVVIANGAHSKHTRLWDGLCVPILCFVWQLRKRMSLFPELTTLTPTLMYTMCFVAVTEGGNSDQSVPAKYYYYCLPSNGDDEGCSIERGLPV